MKKILVMVCALLLLGVTAEAAPERPHSCAEKDACIPQDKIRTQNKITDEKITPRGEHFQRELNDKILLRGQSNEYTYLDEVTAYKPTPNGKAYQITWDNKPYYLMADEVIDTNKGLAVKGNILVAKAPQSELEEKKWQSVQQYAYGGELSKREIWAQVNVEEKRVSDKTTLKLTAEQGQPQIFSYIIPADTELRELEVKHFEQIADTTINAPVYKAASLAQVFEATPALQYWVEPLASGEYEIIFHLPHWSVHEIEILGLSIPIPPPSVIIGITMGVGISAVAAGIMFYPRKQGY